MWGNGKQHNWKISFHRTSSPKSKAKLLPNEFVCQISGLLMADPVIVASGQTFERVSVQVCRDLRYSPLLSDGTRPDFSNLIPNQAIKMTILKWCEKNGIEHPKAPDSRWIEAAVRTSMGDHFSENERFGYSETELLRGVAEKAPVTFSHASTEVGLRPNHFHSGSYRDSGAVATPLPLTTLPACYSSSSSPTDMYPDGDQSSPEEEEFLSKMNSPEVSEQEDGVISLRKLTRLNEGVRVSICTSRILQALRPLILSRHAVIQTNAMAVLVNLSLENANKSKIVRSGMVPPLIDVLIDGFPESQEHAAGAIFSLSLEDDNKTAIGVLGGLEPLMHALRSDSDRTRHDSALALYHLSLIQSNRVKLLKLNAVTILLNLLLNKEMSGRVILILCNLATCNEGKAAMLDSNAVQFLVGMLKSDDEVDEATSENVVAALYSLSHGSMRFKGLAKDAGAVEALRMVEEKGTKRAKEKAKKILQTMRGGEGRRYEDQSGDWEGVLDSGGLSRTRYRVGLAGAGKNLYGVNTTEF